MATWSYLGPLAAFDMQSWPAFIAWACFFHAGGKTEGLTRTIVCMSFGAVVRIGAAAIVLAAHVGVLSTIPACVHGFAAIAGWILLKGVAPTSQTAFSGILM